MSKIKILHLANDYSGSKVYKNLISSLDFNGLSQIVYTAVRDQRLIERNEIKFEKCYSKVIYSNILNNYTRLNFNYKIKKIYEDICIKIDLDKINLIHAHTWYSDGAIAYEIYKKYKIPYIVTIRNTDLNLFFRYMLHLRNYAVKILLNAKQIIFISPIYKKRLFENIIFKQNRDYLIHKSEILPNGIDNFWIQNLKNRRDKIHSPAELIYIGNFNKGKNVLGLINAVELLNKKNINCHLNIVGGGGNQFSKVLKRIYKSSIITYHGKISNKKTLEKIFMKCDIFTMPSHKETFGLVYIEALSQGIPVLYTKNEGIYGYYDGLIGEPVISGSVNSIAEGLSKLIKNYENYLFDPSDIVKNHNWDSISKKYLKIYEK